MDQFLAENEMVEIVTNQHIPLIPLLNKPVGPFRPLERHLVPVWLAILLRSKQKCKIILPSWLSVGYK